MFSFIKRYRRQRRLQQLLAGRPKEAVLQEAPYAFGWFQGEDGYRIWDKRETTSFVHFAGSTEDAELWIIERYLSETNGLPNTPPGCYEASNHYERENIRQRLDELLAGQDKNTALQAVPYAYNKVLDNYSRPMYVIWDKRAPVAFVHWTGECEAAELWIIERYLAETQELPTPLIGTYEFNWPNYKNFILSSADYAQGNYGAFLTGPEWRLFEFQPEANRCTVLDRRINSTLYSAENVQDAQAWLFQQWWMYMETHRQATSR